jgi:hypothetical protein
LQHYVSTSNLASPCSRGVMSLLTRKINSRLRTDAAVLRMKVRDLTTQRATLESEVSALSEQLHDRCLERDRARRLLVGARERVTMHATYASTSDKLNDQLRDDNYALKILVIKLQWQYGALETEHKEVLDDMRQFDDMRQEHDRRRRVLRLLIQTGPVPRWAASGQKHSATQ